MIVEKLFLRHKIVKKALNIDFTIASQIPINSSINPISVTENPFTEYE